MIAALYDDAHRWADGAPLEDDVTMVLLKMRG